ncbi:hypothetical protein CE91St38_13870 [Desulfovibrionaceae bacterium]|uniref:hypothetical protein n=1 Tax=uncultured Desulfovibrio sp. TaxID=167968 RepID=UPI002082B4A4|nr:hypothetical protein [uncultured Desulfovibrio sp.]GKG93379.1 hypothetical protein CE91St38_13870 [Desulfovibrionaceae bacterium]GKI11932.1 hypothetical protein CE91St39_13860 [Desulfovibrionaceae bacterium]
MDKTLMILGLGGVGTYAAHLAGRLPGVRVAVGDIRADHARRVANSLIADSYFLQEYRRFPEVAGFGIDMLDTEAIAEALERYRPDVIFNATTLLSWWHLHRLPHDLARRIYYGAPEGSGLRPWAPGHGVLLYNLMKTVKQVLPGAHVVNVSGPDYLHEILGKVGLAPTVGVGNVSLFEPMLKAVVAEKRGTRPEAVDITLVGHHCMCMQIFQEGALAPGIPYYLKVEENKRDITAELDVDKDLWARVPERMPLLSEVNQQCVAASAMQVIKAMLYDAGALLHAPGPEGLPAGCPVWVDAAGARAVTPPDLSREGMLEIMYGANRCEGFEPTGADGAARATEHCIRVVEEVFGINWRYKEFRPDTMLEAFREITDAFAALLERKGIATY